MQMRKRRYNERNRGVSDTLGRYGNSSKPRSPRNIGILQKLEKEGNRLSQSLQNQPC